MCQPAHHTCKHVNWLDALLWKTNCEIFGWAKKLPHKWILFWPYSCGRIEVSLIFVIVVRSNSRAKYLPIHRWYKINQFPTAVICDWEPNTLSIRFFSHSVYCPQYAYFRRMSWHRYLLATFYLYKLMLFESTMKLYKLITHQKNFSGK